MASDFAACTSARVCLAVHPILGVVSARQYPPEWTGNESISSVANGSVGGISSPGGITNSLGSNR